MNDTQHHPITVMLVFSAAYFLVAFILLFLVNTLAECNKFIKKHHFGFTLLSGMWVLAPFALVIGLTFFISGKILDQATKLGKYINSKMNRQH